MMWRCESANYYESITVSQKPGLFQRTGPLRSDLGLSSVEQLQCFFPMSGYTTGADGCCITLSIWLQTKASHPHKDRKLQHDTNSFSWSLYGETSGNQFPNSSWHHSFNRFASSWNSQTERNLKSSKARTEHQKLKTNKTNVLGMVLQPNCFSSTSSASCQQPATLAAHRAALQVVMLGVRPARIISLAVQMAETHGAGVWQKSRFQQNEVRSSRGCSCFVPNVSLRSSSGHLLNPPRMRITRSHLSNISYSGRNAIEVLSKERLGLWIFKKDTPLKFTMATLDTPKTINLLV